MNYCQAAGMPSKRVLSFSSTASPTPFMELAGSDFYSRMVYRIKIVKLALLACCFAANTWAQQGFFLNDWQPKNAVPPPYTEVVKPSGAVTTTITINPSNIITRVSPYLFGNNANPYMTQMVTEPVLINHIKNLSPRIIRFPGGNISSVYFWNANKDDKPINAPDSLYDSNGNRVTAGYWYGNNKEGWTLSVDNYYKMLEQTNSTGIITTNYSYARYGLGDDPVADAAHLAANWVRYDSGRTKYWEIGNEDAGPWQAGFRIDTSTNRDGQPQIITGTLYGKHLKVFVDSMKKAASETGSTIYIGAQLIQYDAANSWNVVDRTWNEGYFSAAGNTADFYIVHSYYTPFAENTNAANILKTAADETKMMMDWMKTTTSRAGVELKPIALTEWNIFAEGSMQAVSHINGMHATLVIGELIKNGFGMASRWDLANGWSNGNDHGTFNNGDEPGGVPKWNPRPSFFHMYYYQKFFGDQMVQSAVSGNSDIVTYASSFASDHLGVVLVNKGTTNQVTQLNISNFIVGRYYWYTLSGGGENGEFSRKVLVNGVGPDGVAGGPANYSQLPANSATGYGDVRVSVPPRSAVYILVGKGDLTSVPDIDPQNKLVKVSPNPAPGGSFIVSFVGTPEKMVNMRLYDSLGDLVNERNESSPRTVRYNLLLPAGIYRLSVRLKQGVTTKTLVVR